jgi:hypothetical protein
MKNLNLNNETFRRILKEELEIVRNVINENYSADKIWSSMSEKDRNEALYSAKAMNPDELLNVVWDQIPADVQDTIDLSDYELANDDQIGRTNLRAIAGLSSKDAKAKQIVDRFIKATGRQSIQTLTKKQSTKLLAAIHSRDTGNEKPWNPNDFGNIDIRSHGSLGS